MNLPAIFGFYLLGLSCLAAGYQTPTAPQSPGQPPTAASSTQQSQSGGSAPEVQTAPEQSPELKKSVPPSAGQTSGTTGQTKPSPTKRTRHKKTVPPDCSTAPAVLKTAANPPDETKPAEPGSSSPGSSSTGSTTADTPTLKPCPPPKKVVRNGGSEEPSIQLVGGENAEQAVHQRSTDQLTVATEENLKKIALRQLSPGQQEMVSQIKQFMDQSKTALAAGDLERGHNLALKAHLLSDELMKP
jgi:hypothetical protein